MLRKVQAFRLDVNGADSFAEFVDGRARVFTLVTWADASDQQRDFARRRIVLHLIFATFFLFSVNKN